MQKRTLDSMMGVAGKPTTTTPMFLFNISLPKALVRPTWEEEGQERHLRKEAEFISGRMQTRFAALKIKRSLSLSSRIEIAALPSSGCSKLTLS